MQIHKESSSILPYLNLQEHVPLADKNWFKTGGLARYYCEPKNEQEFAQALAFAASNNLEVFTLGSGANVLISDDGFDGLIIRPGLKNIQHTLTDNLGALVNAGAGTDFGDLIEYCLHHNLMGLEEFSGIPGTVGGSVYINIHYYEFLLAQFLTQATVINKKTGQLLTVDNAWFAFGYDTSTLHQQEYYLLSATFAVKQATALEIAHAQGRRQEIIRHRVRRYPTSGTCGSFFRNFSAQEVANTDKKLIFVAYYLDKIGVKGELQVGGATVSYQHANMLVNKGFATSADIINLARQMQELVLKSFGIIPQAECQFIGFKQNPLL